MHIIIESYYSRLWVTKGTSYTPVACLIIIRKNMECTYYKQKQKTVQCSWTTKYQHDLSRCETMEALTMCFKCVWVIVCVSAKFFWCYVCSNYTCSCEFNHFKDFSLHSCNVHVKYKVCKHANMHSFLPSWFWRSSGEGCTLMSYLSSLQRCISATVEDPGIAIYSSPRSPNSTPSQES